MATQDECTDQQPAGDQLADSPRADSHPSGRSEDRWIAAVKDRLRRETDPDDTFVWTDDGGRSGSAFETYTRGREP